MHAWVTSTLIPLLDHQLKAGEVYEISNFTVVPFTEKLKCFESEIHVVLSDLTDVKALLEDYSHNVFHFMNLQHIRGAEKQDNHLIGTISLPTIIPIVSSV